MTPSLEELASTISVAIWGIDYKPREPHHLPDVRWTHALDAARAVVRALEPALMLAYRQGKFDIVGASTNPSDRDYAARLVAQITQAEG